MNEKLVIQKFILFNKKYKLIENNDKILVALSGGPDSIFLISILVKIKNIFNIEISAIHINHNLRGKESKRDEQFVREFCLRENLPLIIKSKNVKQYAKKNKLGIEEAGREIRYAEFNRTLKKLRYTKIATGHNANDNLETILFNFIRGTGLKGLCGINLSDGKIIRPILCFARNEIIEYLDEHNLYYVLDSTNSDINFRRNFIRNKIVPLCIELNKNIIDNSLHFSEIMRDYYEYLIKNFIIFEKNISVDKNIVILENLNNKNYFNSLFKLFVQEKIKNIYNVLLNFTDLEKLSDLVTKSKGKFIELNYGLIAFREKDKIIIKKKSYKKDFYKEVNPDQLIIDDNFTFLIKRVDKFVLDNSSLIEYIDLDKLKGQLILRNWYDGDKIKPLGMKGYKKVKEILSDKKILSTIKKDIMVLCDDNKIIWICGVILSDDYKIDKNTKNIAKMEVKYNFGIK